MRMEVRLLEARWQLPIAILNFAAYNEMNAMRELAHYDATRRSLPGVRRYEDAISNV